MRFCFPKSARLNRASEFAKIKAEGHTSHGKFLLLGSFQTGESQPAKIGLITSRRIGCAVERNRVRRRLRELTRKSRPEIKPGLQLVVIARRSAVAASFIQLEEDWLRASQRAGIFKA
jgi:ribonuclease P protein component